MTKAEMEAKTQAALVKPPRLRTAAPINPADQRIDEIFRMRHQTRTRKFSE